MGAFENFVNVELPRRVGVQQLPASGNFPAGKPLVTTGIGLTVAPDVETSTAERTTLLTVVSPRDVGCSFYINSSGTYYTKELDDGDLRETAEEFNHDEAVQIYLNGVNLVKGEHAIWTSRYSFSFGFGVDAGDFIKVLS